jgi:hypothetical protein
MLKVEQAVGSETREACELRSLQDLAYGLEIHLRIASDKMRYFSQELAQLRKLVLRLIEELDRVSQPASKKMSKVLAQNLACLVRHLLRQMAQEPEFSHELDLAQQFAHRLEERLSGMLREAY